jgi:Lon-like protease
MSTSEITLPPGVAAPPRRRRLPVVLVSIGILLVIAVVVSSLITVPYYELVPGSAQSVAPLITVPQGKGHPLHGRFLLTDVSVVENLRLIGLLPAWLDSDATLVKTVDITGGLPAAEYNAEGTVDMAESQLTAQAVALRQLGYSVPERDVGVTVYALAPGTPGYQDLAVGDVITSVDGVPTTNPTELVNAVHSYRSGDTITLAVGTIDHPTPGRQVRVRLTASRYDGQPILLGLVGMGTQPAYDLPFRIKINSDDIGGPSAGLAWTLGIINSLSGGHLTDGKTIAATGTIRPDGSVGDVGGVLQKTVAVENAGATVFFVPDYPDSVQPARSKATPGLKVFPVSSLAQVMRDLRSLGGKLGAAAAGPPPGPGGHSVPSEWQDSPWS